MRSRKLRAMEIAIGELKLATARPADLDEQLLVVTGCNAAELAEQLGRGATGFQIARALAPFIAPSDVDLAAAIDAADDVAIGLQVAALLASPSEETSDG